MVDQRDGFEERLRKAQARQDLDNPSRSAGGGLPQGSWGFGLRVGIEIVSALAVGAILGVVLDRWLGTTPWLFLLFFFVGGAAGIRNLYRMVSRGREG
ncbi:AtpZ/AtpI family protein [Roseomonas gilardii]|uniref:AtpZ/AtpI family protein n=1 Tax=Roseomonas gilardii TaxID=257708 RepID=UPI00047F98B4|nr:AtpZ/AtpI family protein [Roseomonas gilardii]SUE43088.1 ATP synthase protein I [Roseomonas gilardii subsp. rosea]